MIDHKISLAVNTFGREIWVWGRGEKGVIEIRLQECKIKENKFEMGSVTLKSSMGVDR